MSENKHYGRQVFVSLFLTVFILILVVFLSARYLLPLYDIRQDQLYGILVKLFPLLIGLVMIEIGVIIARRRDEEYTDEVDKLPPNAYDKPFYSLPGDDPDRIPSAEMSLGQPAFSPAPASSRPVDFSGEAERPTEEIPVASVAGAATVQTSLPTYANEFDSIFGVELQDAVEMDYDLTLVLVEVSSGPREEIADKISAQSADSAYTFTLDDGKIALVLPFYNNDEARSFMLGMLEGCRKEFAGSLLQLGFASRNGRIIEAGQLRHEAEVACSVTQPDEDNGEAEPEDGSQA